VTTNHLPKQRLPLLATMTSRRADRLERRRLLAELTDYSTQAERNDLNALLDTYPDDEVAEIRELLNSRVGV
jgi:hypothetical protein